MHKITVSGGPLMLGSGEIAHLTAAQLSSRRHNVEVIEPSKNGSATVKVIHPLHFKEGEEITVANVPKSAAAAMRDQVKPVKTEAAEKAPSKKALKASFDEGRAEGLKTLAEEVKKASVQVRKDARAELLAEIAARNDLVDALEAAQAAQEGLPSDADDEARAAAQKTVDEAQAAVDALQPLEA